MRLAIVMMALLAGAAAPAAAQTFDIGTEVDGYRRFLVYPHLQKGHESLRRGDHRRAIAELERARELAPDSPTVAMQLADAYAAGGDRARAEALLTRQLTRTPDDGRVKDALRKLRAPAGVALTAPRNAASAGRGGSAAPEAASANRERGFSAPPSASSAARPADASRPAATRARRSEPVKEPAAPPAAPIDPIVVHRAGFDAALREGRTTDAAVHAVSLLDAGSGAPLLDEVTFRLMEAGGREEALALLAAGYPYAGGTLEERERLLGRLLMLVPHVPGPAAASASSALRVALDHPALRSQQASYWMARQECGVVATVLADMSPDYSHDDFVRLGDCLKGVDADRAERAYARAHAVQPGGSGTRSVAYAAAARRDYVTAVAAWRAVPVDVMTAAELDAATTAALSANDLAQARVWLDAWRQRGGESQYAFWSASAAAAADPRAEVEARRRALELKPNADDALRLARMEGDRTRQLALLERTAALDPVRADVQRELGYAYQRAGRENAALQAFERAARLDPESADAHLQVAYGHWHAGDADAAAKAFGRAWALRPEVASADGLVYAHERLGHGRDARWYAEQAIDLGSAGVQERAAIEREFGLRRLHEDLGRRVTVSLDGYGGTRAGTGSLSAGRDGRISSSYSQLEVDLRLGSNPVRGGRTLSAYTRVMADGGLDSMVPSRHPTLGAGLRWKPFRSQVIYFAGEYQRTLDDRDVQDVLLRTSASFLNGGRFSDDWHPAGGGWFSQNLYLDAAHYVDAARTAATADYRASYHAKVGRASTLEPYAHVQVNGVRVTRVQDDTRAGAGLRWNLWYGASRYNAPRHKLAVGVEFQQAIETYLPETRGVYLTLGARW